MNVSGIRPSDGFYENNQTKFRPEFNPIPTEEKLRFGEGPSASVEISKEGFVVAKKQVEKAVSDMEEDSVIHRYQYFVHNKSEVTANPTQVRGTENFSL